MKSSILTVGAGGASKQYLEMACDLKFDQSF